MKKYVGCTLLVALSSLLCGQTTYNISTIAGSIASANGDNVNASSAPILNPQAIVVDSAGNVYIADGDAHRVRKIETATGRTTVIAGQGRAAGSSDTAGPGTASPLNNPTGLALDPTSKILYIGERDNHKIKKLDLASGVLTTIVGYAGRAGYAGDGQSALYSRIRNPYGLATDKDGNLYITDRGNNRIRKVCIATQVKSTDCTTGNITTVAGIGPVNADPAYFIQYRGDGGPATRATLARPEAVAVDSLNNIYIADTNNNAVRKVDGTTGIITTLIGDCIEGAPLAVTGSVPGFLPLGSVWPTCGPGTQATAASPLANNAANGRLLTTFIDGTVGSSATLNGPRGLAVDSANNLYIADTGTNRIRFYNAVTGSVTTFAGSGTAAGFAGDGSAANRATLSAPRAVAVAPNGDVYIADQTQSAGGIGNNAAGGRIRVVDVTNGTIRTVNGGTFQGDTGAAANAVFFDPRGVAVDAAGNVYIADTSNQRIRKVNITDGTINTIAGRGVAANTGDGGLATNAALNNPNCAAVDAAGNVYIADRSNNRVRKVDAAGNITTVAGGGTGNVSPDGQLAVNAVLNGPRCVAVDNLGNLYIADTGNNAIRKVDASGVITTVAGIFIQSPLPSANGAWIGVNGPQFVAVNNAGPFSLQGTNSPEGDGGPATAAYLNGPQGIAVDPQGTRLYIADTGNHAVRVVNLNTGIITLVAGGYTDAASDGAPAGITVPAGSIGTGELTRLNTPTAVAADGAGNVYIADSLNYRIVKVDKDLNVFVIAGTGTAWGDNKAALSVAVLMPRGIAVDKDGNVYFTEPTGIIRKLTPQK